MSERTYAAPNLAERERLKTEGNLGRADCDDPGCTRMNGLCIGLHCCHCDQPIGLPGHLCEQKAEAQHRMQEDLYDKHRELQGWVAQSEA